MLTMSQINHIKDLSNCGYRISEISEKTGADPKTIRKYLSQNDFSPKPPILLNQSYRNGWAKIKSAGASSTTPPSGSMSDWWRNMAISEATVLFSAI